MQSFQWLVITTQFPNGSPSHVSCVYDSLWLYVTPWSVAHQTPLSMVFPAQEYWSGLPFPPPRDFAKQGIEPVSLALTGKFFSTEPPGKPYSRGLVTMNISSVWAGSCGMFLEQPLSQTLCLSSFLDYVDNSIWCRFPELLFTCEHPLHPKWKMLVQFRQFSRTPVRVRLFVTP